MAIHNLIHEDSIGVMASAMEPHAIISPPIGTNPSCIFLLHIMELIKPPAAIPPLAANINHAISVPKPNQQLEEPLPIELAQRLKTQQNPTLYKKWNRLLQEEKMGMKIDKSLKKKLKKTFHKMFISNYLEQLAQYFYLGKATEQKFIEN